MAEEAVDAATQQHPQLAKKAGLCVTATTKLNGASGYTEDMFARVAQGYRVPHRPGFVDSAVAKHLANSYGCQAFQVMHTTPRCADIRSWRFDARAHDTHMSTLG